MTDAVYPIYVASKGRPDNATCAALKACNLPYTVVVEPQEAASYRAMGHADIAVLPASGKGLGYVRQWIKDAAPPDAWYWMLDDDITHFYQVVQNRTVKVPVATALLGSQRLFAPMHDVSQVGLEYQQYAWSSAKAYRLNTYCDVCVAIHTGRTRHLAFRSEFALKVDRDFTLQVLASGYRTACITRYAFSAPTNGSNHGGLADIYACNGRELVESRLMARYWPGICEVQQKSNGRHDVKIAWKKLAS